MRVQCKGCKEEREVFPKRDTKDGYEKRRPLCKKCGNKKRIKTLGGHAPNWQGGRHVTARGYARIWIGPGSKYIFEHHHVWIEKNGPIPAGYIIHHRDNNKLNNNIENLECMTKTDHDKMNPGIMEAWKYRWGYKTKKEICQKESF